VSFGVFSSDWRGKVNIINNKDPKKTMKYVHYNDTHHTVKLSAIRVVIRSESGLAGKV